MMPATIFEEVPNVDDSSNSSSKLSHSSSGGDSSSTPGSPKEAFAERISRPPSTARKPKRGAKGGRGRRFNRSTSRASTMSRRSNASNFHAELLSQMSLEGDAIAQRIQLNETELTTVTSEIQKMSAKIQMKRRTAAGLRQAASSGRGAARKLATLDRRAEKVRARLNAAKATNQQLREKINEKRRHRVSFQSILRKLEVKFEAKREEMARLVEESAQANRQLDRTATALQRVEQQTIREKAEFKSQWSELGETIKKEMAHEIKTKRLQSKRPSPKSTQRKPGVRRPARQSGMPRRKALRLFGGNPNDADKDTKSLVANLEKLRSKTSAALSDKRVAEYQAAFEKIQEITGATTMDELVTLFIAAEERNYSLFRYASQINAELEQQNQAIAELDAEIEKFRGLGMESDDKRRRVLESLITRLERTETKIDEHEMENETAHRQLTAIVQAVETLFHELGCDDADGADLLRDTGITPTTLMPHLGLIEQRTHELLQQYATLMPRRNGRSVAATTAVSLGQGPSVPTGTVRLVVPPPRLDDFDDDSALADNRPLTRTELHGMMYNSAAFAAIKQAISSGSPRAPAAR